MPKFDLLYMIPVSLGISALLLVWISANQAAERLRRSQMARGSVETEHTPKPVPFKKVVRTQVLAWVGALVATCTVVYMSRDIEAPIYPAFLAMNLTISVGALMFAIHLAIWQLAHRFFTLTTIFIDVCVTLAFVVSCFLIIELTGSR